MNIRLVVSSKRKNFHDLYGFKIVTCSENVGFIPPKVLIGLSSHENFAMSDRNIVYIGNKPIMNYCLAVLSSLQGDGSTVHLKARGRAISSAVDVAEVTRNRFLNDLSVDSIEIGTEELENQEGQKRNVSTITITLKKG